MATELDITDKADSPKRQRTDEGSVEERSVDDLTKAKNYAATESAITRSPFGLRFARGKPGGTV